MFILFWIEMPAYWKITINSRYLVMSVNNQHIFKVEERHVRKVLVRELSF